MLSALRRSIITEYLVNISRRAFWSLNEDILKITILTTNTPCPSRKIRRIRACTHQRPQRKLDQYAVSGEDQYAVLEIRHFKTLSLDELRSPDFDLLSDQEYSEEEVAETMAETMEQNYVVTPSAVQIMKMQTNTMNENLYQAWERFKELLMECPQHYLAEMQEVILFYNGLGIPSRQILDSRGAIPSKTAADAKVAIQEMAKYSQKWHNGTSRSRSTETSNGLVSIQAQLNNLRREIKKVNEKVYAAQVDANNAKDPITPKIAHSKKKGKP
ncbi:hypothetical protein Tco_1329050 [Tanacetum coccineum]